MSYVNTSITIRTVPKLTGSWRNFSPRLDDAVAARFREIEAGTVEALQEAALRGGRVMELPPLEPPMQRP